MKDFVINGKFMSDRMLGMVRYAREILLELDKILEPDTHVTLAIPNNAFSVPEYQNIRIHQIGKHRGIKWEQIDLGIYMRKHKESLLINFCNVVPFFIQPGITVVHDIIYKVRPEYYISLRNKISRLWHVLQYQYLFNHEKQIITVSNYSKNEIEKNYKVTKGKIRIIPCAWQHILTYKEDPNWQDKYPFLRDRHFFFSLATRSKNKNGNWIFEIAKKNPSYTFAIAGNIYEKESEEIPSNIFMLGYVSNEIVCSLIKHCRAFIYPSLYEGFGMPPLEALALGAEVLSSNSTSLPEVLGKSAHFFNPYDTDIDIDILLSQQIEDNETVLKNYSWKQSAQLMHNMMIEFQ